MEDYVESNEFKVMSYSATKATKYYPCCSEPYPDLMFRLELQRSSAGHIVVLPVLTSLLMLAVFWMPPHSPCRFGLCKYFPERQQTLCVVSIWR